MFLPENVSSVLSVVIHFDDIYTINSSTNRDKKCFGLMGKKFFCRRRRFFNFVSVYVMNHFFLVIRNNDALSVISILKLPKNDDFCRENFELKHFRTWCEVKFSPSGIFFGEKKYCSGDSQRGIIHTRVQMYRWRRNMFLSYISVYTLKRSLEYLTPVQQVSVDSILYALVNLFSERYK